MDLVRRYVVPARKKRERLLVSFSGGRTSALLAWLLTGDGVWGEIVVVFANTGQEDEETLRFVERCDREWGLGVVWVEADVIPERGQGTRHRVVSYETAARVGEPYEAAIAKFGIAHSNNPFCTRELKLRPITSYVRSIGWAAGSYNTAVGIRADEIDRVRQDALDDGYVYPLIDLGVSKADVNAWWATRAFNLAIPEHYGNCVWCWKKSFRKLATVARERPEAFDFPRRMELEHAFTGPLATKTGLSQAFFRGRRSADSILAEAVTVEPYVDPLFSDARLPAWDTAMDMGGACGDSCEVGADEFPLEDT